MVTNKKTKHTWIKIKVLKVCGNCRYSKIDDEDNLFCNDSEELKKDTYDSCDRWRMNTLALKDVFFTGNVA